MEWHVPGNQFLGPGTHIVDRINRRVLPSNRTDFVAMLHDIDYLMGAGDKGWTRDADFRAISQARNSILDHIMKVGLSFRVALGLDYNTYTTNTAVASKLMTIVKSDPTYVERARQLGVNLDAYPDRYNRIS